MVNGGDDLSEDEVVLLFVDVPLLVLWGLCCFRGFEFEFEFGFVDAGGGNGDGLVGIRLNCDDVACAVVFGTECV